MEALVIALLIYVHAATFYGLFHASQISRKVTEAGLQAEQLSEWVLAHQLTSKGAAYFTELQQLHLQKGEWIEDYKAYKDRPLSYLFPHFIWGFILFPYLLFMPKKAKQKAED